MANDIDFTPLETGIQFEPIEEVHEEEPVTRKIARGIPRTLARGAEAIVGLPGDIMSAISKLPEIAERKVGIKTGIDYENLRKLLGGPFGAPTSEEIRETLKGATGEYLEPRTKGEEIGDILAGDLATLMLPVKGKVPFKRALAQVVGGNMVSYLTQEVGGTEGEAAAAKVGTFIALGMIGRGGINARKEKLYDIAKDLVPETAVVDAAPMEKIFSSIEKQFARGTSTPGRSVVLRQISELKNKIKKGKIEVKDLIESKKTVNANMGDPTLLKGDRKFLKRVVGSLHQTIDSYGRKNPEFLKTFREADEIHGALVNSNKILRIFKKVKDIKNPLTWVMLGLHPAATAGTIAGTTGLRAVSVLKRSPAIRRFYLNALKEAAKGNSKEAFKYARKLDDQISQEEPIEFEE